MVSSICVRICFTRPSIAFLVPAPSMIVVLSLSIVTRLAVPRSSSLMFSSFTPRSSVIARPSVRIAMSSSIALRRSPKPGAFTPATFSVPRSLLTTNVASASPSRSSAMTRSAFPDCAIFSRIGSRSFIAEMVPPRYRLIPLTWCLSFCQA